MSKVLHFCPKRVKLRTLMVDPIDTKSTTDIADPSRETLLILNALPILTNSKVERALPTREKLRSDKDEPTATC
jgi:hypothetical protein